MAVKEYDKGWFAGRALVQSSGKLGGVRNVFVKLKGISNELVFPTFGGQVKNPFKGAGKMYAGDLAEFRTDDNGKNPVIYLLKTYEVASGAGTTLNIYRDGYRHRPFVGDILTVAPDEVGGTGTALTVVNVAPTKETIEGKETKIWKLTLSTAATVTKGDVLVECDTDGMMLVKNINAVLPCDYDFMFAPNTGEEEESTEEEMSARYFLTPALGGLMYTHQMSPMPECVKKLNTAKVNGWFKIGSWGNF